MTDPVMAEAVYRRWKAEHDHPRARAYARELALALSGPRNPNRSMVPEPAGLPKPTIEQAIIGEGDVFLQVCDAHAAECAFLSGTRAIAERERREAEQAEAKRRWREETGHTHDMYDEYGRPISDEDCAVCWREYIEEREREHWQAVDDARARKREGVIAVVVIAAVIALAVLFAALPA